MTGTHPQSVGSHRYSFQFFAKFLLGLGLVFCLPGCVSVESYQKMYINDRDMQLSSPQVQSFEVDFQSYREGASGGNGGKTGGGCGCN